jgi:hypothetical protein
LVIVLPIASLWVVQAVAAHAVSAALYTVAVVFVLGIALYFYWELTLFLLSLFWEFFKAYPATASALLLAILFVWGCCARLASRRKRRADSEREEERKAARERQMELDAEIARLRQALSGKSAEVDALHAEKAAKQEEVDALQAENAARQEEVVQLTSQVQELQAEVDRVLAAERGSRHT